MHKNLIGILSLLVAISIIAGCPRGHRTSPRYTVTDLGTLGGNLSNGLAVNDQGQVVGLSKDASGFTLGFVWDEATGIHSVGALGSRSEAWDINEYGQVVGESVISGGDSHAFLWTPDTMNGTTGAMVDLGTLGGPGSGSWQINDMGQVTGWADIPTWWRPFLWTPTSPNGSSGTMADLGTLGGPYGETYAINAMGQTAGKSLEPDHNYTRATLWTPDTANGDTGMLDDIGTLGGNTAEARDINASGEVVGKSALEGDAEEHAFKWTPDAPNGYVGAMVDLGTLGGDTSYAYGINDQGEAVGQSTYADASEGAFLWDSTRGMVDLNAYLVGRDRYDSETGMGWQISIARDINCDGWIVGTGTLNDGEPHAVLLRPAGHCVTCAD